MSTVYHTEPPTQGKVVIKTSFGDIDVELWAKEAPLACRNFIQLALEGLYDNTIVHRVIKGFMVQMGDPTGTGNGGDSIWGKPFKDEIHGRIKFNHRGQVAMANENKAHTNKSQFFITLDNCDWLNGKHTIFGKITGSTVFNVLRMGEVEVGENDVPVDEIKLIGVDVLWNPFDDIIPRDMSHLVKKPVEVQEVKPQKPERKAVKNASLLSFDDGNEEEEGAVAIGKFHSSHDSKFKSKKLSSKVAVNLDTPNANGGSSSVGKGGREGDGTEDSADLADDSKLDREDNFDRHMKNQILLRRMKAEQEKIAAEGGGGGNNAGNSSSSSSGGGSGRSGASAKDQEALLDERAMAQLVSRASQQETEMKNKSEEFKKLRAELLKSRRAVNVLTGAEAEALRQETSFKEMISPLEQRRAKYMKRKNEFGSRSEETLAKLQKFQESLRASTHEELATSAVAAAPAPVEKEKDFYHGQVMEEREEVGADGGDEGADQLKDWHQGKLKFKKHIDDRYRLGMSGPEDRSAMEEGFTVYDPRGTFSTK